MVTRYLGLRVLVICRNCGFKLYTYDADTKTKFNGAPNPFRSLSYHGYRCPACDRLLVPKPSIKLMSGARYKEQYDESEYFVHEKKGDGR